MKNLFESLNDWDGRWLHFTDHDMLTVNSKNYTHSDPKGIYFFPENYQKIASYWLGKKNCFSVSFKPTARILDLATIDENGIWDLVKAVGAEDIFNNYIKEYPPKTTIKMLDMAWEMMKQKMMRETGKWNAILRNLGWDAIFDDTLSIHTSEVQMLVLNPSIITDVKRIDRKPDIYNKMLKIISDIKSMDFGDLKIMVNNPKQVNLYGQKSINAYIIFSEKEYDPEVYDYSAHYAKVKITYDPKHAKDRISINLQYSNPTLRYGSGTSYFINTNKYDDFGSKSGLENFRNDILKVFAVKTEQVGS